MDTLSKNSVAPLVTKLVKLKEKVTTPKFVVCNPATSQKLYNEAMSVNEAEQRAEYTTICGLVLVIKPQDSSTDIDMEVV